MPSTRPLCWYEFDATLVFVAFAAEELAGFMVVARSTAAAGEGPGKLRTWPQAVEKKYNDAHNNPTIMLDDAVYIRICSASHGTSRPSWTHRSRRPYSVDEF